MKNLYIVALFQFKENDLMDALELLRKLVNETRKEEGCMQYDLVEDYENKGVFFIMELWESVEHHHQHNGTDHLMQFRIQSARMLEKSAEVYKGFKTF
jgi:quinol monooxygenase YgiN